MIRPDIDPEPIRRELQARGRIQIRDWLTEEAAQRLHACLAQDVPWSLALCDAAGMRTLDVAEYARLDDEARARLFRETAASARGGEYRFAYDTYMMPRAYMEGRDPGLLLHRVLELFNSPEYLGLLRAITGDDRIRRLGAQATRYRTGQFLRTHNDEDSGAQRLYAYVLNLSRRWVADWGGLLSFVDHDERVMETWLPLWNSLSVFKVPLRHNVSLIAPWAEEDRYAITGWMLGTANVAEQRAREQGAG